MSMSKKDFIALADTIREQDLPFTDGQVKTLADFCRSQNPDFKRDRWLSYIAGKCGPSGGKRREHSEHSNE